MPHDLVQFVPTPPKVAYGWRLPDGRDGDISTLPGAFGWTEIVQHPVRDGIRLSEVRTHPKSPIVFSTRQRVPHSSLTFSFQCAGANRAHHPGLGESTSRLDRFRMMRLAPTDEISLYENRVGVTSDVMTLTLSPERLGAMLEGQMPPPLIEEFNRGSFAPSLDEMRLTPAMSRALQQMRTNPYQGAMAALYIEAKILELLAEIFSELDDYGRPSDRASSRGRRAAMAARDLLMSDLSNPPSMEDLARHVGLTQRRLSELFRETFGATPFQCLARWRLDQARHLLISGELSVKQVAHLMGYAHISSFSHAYSRRFGTTPTRDDFS